MEQDQPNEEKKIWIDPELTFMPMQKINMAKIHKSSEYIQNNDDGDPPISYAS